MSGLQGHRIENESEADAYLSDLLAHEEYRSMDEVVMRANQLISDSALKTYFVNKAEAMLRD